MIWIPRPIRLAIEFSSTPKASQYWHNRRKVVIAPDPWAVLLGGSVPSGAIGGPMLLISIRDRRMRSLPRTGGGTTKHRRPVTVLDNPITRSSALYSNWCDSAVLPER